jgi:hypothetical protein
MRFAKIYLSMARRTSHGGERPFLRMAFRLRIQDIVGGYGLEELTYALVFAPK